LVCIDSAQLSASFAGRDFDASLLRELPGSVDPCGERGEFHSCAYAGPMFSPSIPLAQDEVVHRDGFAYADFRLDLLDERPAMNKMALKESDLSSDQ
jgi:diphthamide synthase (EF-2-diphthine--ammonia ligase)